MSASYLKLEFCKDLQEDNIDEFSYRVKPFQDSNIFLSHTFQHTLLTQGPDNRTTYEVVLNSKEDIPKFFPGNAIAILPQNDKNEVVNLLKRLSLDSVSNKYYRLTTVENSSKKVPSHIPVQGTLLNTFLKYVDIRSVPKKLFLKSLLSFTTNESDINTIEIICSTSGSKQYAEFIKKNRTLVQILHALQSCHPPIEIILQHSTALKPRYFSIASPPTNESKLSIVFSVSRFENDLKGVCTGWLESLVQENGNNEEKLVPFYFRKPSDFQISEKQGTTKIFIAHGTGLAPFLSVLRGEQIRNSNTWLFYGCRHSKTDFICREEILELAKNGTIRLNTAFSREGPEKHYVQDEILKHSKEFVNFVLDQNKKTKIYICGGTQMVKDVKKIIVECIATVKNLSTSSSEQLFNQLECFVDSWI